MIRLHINIDHVATVRQARRTDEPDPVRAAVLAEQGGADGITVHLREDRRHIQDRDVRLLLEMVRTGINLELAAASDVVDFALGTRPTEVTLVPERREEVTTEGGLALEDSASRTRVAGAVARLKEAGLHVSLFIDPDEADIRAAASLEVPAIELHTGEYANAWTRRQLPGGREAVPRQLERLRRGASLGASLGLHVHAGHGLTYENVAPVAGIREIEELNIGHSVVSRAVFVGLERAVRDMKEIVLRARNAGCEEAG